MKKNKDYKKINLRNFRHNLTQVKDSLATGEMYEVVEKGNPVGYFIPAHFDIKVAKKTKYTQEDYQKALLEGMGCTEYKDEVKDAQNYKDAYHKLLDKKYGK